MLLGIGFEQALKCEERWSLMLLLWFYTTEKQVGTNKTAFYLSLQYGYSKDTYYP